MKLKTLFLISVLSFSFNIASSKGGQRDNREVDAAVEVLAAKYSIEYNHQFCRGRAGNYGYKYDYIKYIWELNNREYLQLSEKIFGNLPASRVTEMKKLWDNSRDKMLTDRKSIDNDGNGKYCSQYFSQLLGGIIHKLEIPRRDLAPRLGPIDDVRILERNIGMEVGCIKKGYNSDIKQFLNMQKACNCQTTLVVRKMSDRDIDEYLTLASSKNPQDAAEFIGKRINISDVQACYGQVISR